MRVKYFPYGHMQKHNFSEQSTFSHDAKSMPASAMKIFIRKNYVFHTEKVIIFPYGKNDFSVRKKWFFRTEKSLFPYGKITFSVRKNSKLNISVRKKSIFPYGKNMFSVQSKKHLLYAGLSLSFPMSPRKSYTYYQTCPYQLVLFNFTTITDMTSASNEVILSIEQHWVAAWTECEK